MEHNPYAAPRSIVADVAAPAGKRPRSVSAALVLPGIALAFEVWDAIPALRQVSVGELSVLGFIYLVIRLSVLIWIWTRIARGNNWARYTALVFTLLALAIYLFNLWYMLSSLPPTSKYAPDVRAIIVSASLILFELVALYLLFFPGRDWFRPRAR